MLCQMTVMCKTLVTNIANKGSSECACDSSKRKRKKPSWNRDCTHDVDLLSECVDDMHVGDGC